MERTFVHLILRNGPAHDEQRPISDGPSHTYPFQRICGEGLRTSDELSTGASLFAGGAAAAAVAPSPAQARPQQPARASRPSCDLARGTSARHGPHPRLVAAESPPSTSLAAVGAVRRDAESGLTLLLVVLAAVMCFFLSLTILSFLASRALQKMETAVKKLAKVFAEEVPGTLSSLNLSFMEINDLTRQLKNLRKRLAISRFGKNANSKAS